MEDWEVLIQGCMKSWALLYPKSRAAPPRSAFGPGACRQDPCRAGAMLRERGGVYGGASKPSDLKCLSCSGSAFCSRWAAVFIRLFRERREGVRSVTACE